MSETTPLQIISLTNVLFDATKHERPQHRMQLPDNIVFSRFVRETEPLTKVLFITKDIRHYKVEQRPKLFQVVLCGEVRQTTPMQQRTCNGVPVIKSRNCVPTVRTALLSEESGDLMR